MLSLDTVNLGEGKKTTFLKLTPNQVQGQGDLLKNIFITGSLAKKGKPSVLKSIVRLNAVFEGAGLSQRGGYLSTLLEKKLVKKLMKMHLAGAKDVLEK